MANQAQNPQAKWNYPNSQLPVINSNNTMTYAFYNFLASIWNGTNSRALPVVVQALGLSPWNFQAPQNGTLIITGGADLTITLSRGTQTITCLEGALPVSYTDQVQISFSTAPVVTFIPT